MTNDRSRALIRIVALWLLFAVCGCGPSDTSSDGSALRLRVRTLEVEYVKAHTLKSGGLGDVAVSHGSIRSADGDKQIGLAETLHVMTGSRPLRGQFFATLTLTGRGSIVMAGAAPLHSPQPDARFAVTGGTGEFAGAAGQAQFVAGPNDDGLIMVHLFERGR